jgi:hypothetical protein
MHICRFCFESGDAGSLISPCVCKGTVQFVHRDCLYRWMFLDTDIPNSICPICKTQIDKAYIPSLEVIPRKGSIYYFLDNSVTFALVVHYVSFLMGLWSFMVVSHLIINISYVCLFPLIARVNNWREYIRVSYKSYAFLAAYTIVTAYTLGSDFSIRSVSVAYTLNRYWITHIKALHDVNALLLERFRKG